MNRRVAVLVALAVGGCSQTDDAEPWSAGDASVAEEASPDVPSDKQAESASEAGAEPSPESGADALVEEAAAEAGPCPPDMDLVGVACMDRYEAPNVAGALPLVMFHFDEAASWCDARGKRLCFDDEWTQACAGPDGWSYPYGDTHEPGVCNDDKTWLAYNQDLLNGWPWTVETDAIETLGQLLDTVRAMGTGPKAAADHVEALYQGTAAGTKTGCVGSAGVFDLEGNVEEWTRRRDGGEPSFHGNLKGRYWAEPRTCQQGVITHGDTFRFYEIGFRCCRNP
jgi:formylglycine-generating enzyme required for sulfatase activity